MSLSANTADTVTVATAQSLAETGAAHGFCGATGGVSSGCYASLNTGLATEDTAANVAENRRRALTAIGAGAAELATARQVHGTAVVHAARPLSDERPAADGLISTDPGLAVGVLTADCAPVLVATRDGGVVAAIHAGWRGALAGVVEAAVAALAQRGVDPSALQAAIGPCIGRAAYEVSRGFDQPFLDADPQNRRFFTGAARADKLHFDLAGFVASRLARAGVAESNIETVGIDTYREPAYFSHRASRAAGWGDFGRNLAAIKPVPGRG